MDYGPRLRHFAGQPFEIVDGGAAAPTLVAAPDSGSITGKLGTLMQPQAHHGPIVLVLVAVAVLFLLDKAGFRFAVTAGKR